MIRITLSHADTGPVLHIAGHLDEQHLAEVEQLCGEQIASLVLDLTELQSADPDGLRWLKTASVNGAVIIGATPYIALLIERVAQHSGTPSGEGEP